MSYSQPPSLSNIPFSATKVKYFLSPLRKLSAMYIFYGGTYAY